MDDAGEVLDTLSAALCLFAAGANADTEADQIRMAATFYKAAKERFAGVADMHPVIEAWLADICKVKPDDLRKARGDG